ncbi:MAG: Fic family protein [Sulfuricurvum sp.]
MLPYNPNFLDNTEIFSRDEIDLLEELNAKLPLDEFLQNRDLVETLGFEFVYTSAKIEGNAYTRADATTLLKRGITSSASFSDATMLLNLNRAFEHILSSDHTISRDAIISIHQILASDLLKKESVGAARKHRVTITGSHYEPLADSTLLTSELERVISTSKTIANPYDQALYLHNNLAYLHYFADANKRTARAVLNLSLKSSGKMLLIPSNEDIPLYISGVLEYYEKGNYAGSKEFLIKSYERVARHFNKI